MTKQERLHWFYTVLVCIGIVSIWGLGFMKLGVRLANGYTDDRIKSYDSLVAVPRKKESDQLIKKLDQKQDTSLYIQKQILKILKDGKRN